MSDLMFEPYENRHSAKSKVLRLVWNIVYLVAFRPTPRCCLNWWRVLILKAFGAKIGRRCIVHPNVDVWAPWNVEMEDCACLSEGSVCYCVSKIKFGFHAIVSRDAFLCTPSHEINSRTMALTSKPIELGAHCWVCARATILPGVAIGEGAVVGAAAVVTKDVAPWTIVVGNPARVVGNRKIMEDVK